MALGYINDEHLRLEPPGFKKIPRSSGLAKSIINGAPRETRVFDAARAVAALASDPLVSQKTGQILASFPNWQRNTALLMSMGAFPPGPSRTPHRFPVISSRRRSDRRDLPGAS